MYLPLHTTARTPLIVKTLNNVAVEYFELGLKDLSYQILDTLYHDVSDCIENCGDLLPVISCNMGNMLRQSGYYEEAYRICRQGLTDCFKTGFLYAVPELILQLSILCQYMGNPAQAESFYFLGSVLFQWSRHKTVPYTLYELMEQDFLLYYE
ncbi:MAG: hypothetical protein HFH35_08035 [Eubacterium sp.]|nr:hypothetical protein [Eubacterium sp.]